MIGYWIDGFSDGRFRFLGAYCVYEGDWSILISKNRTSIILSRGLLKSIKEHQVPNELQFKLVERFMASYDDFFLPIQCEMMPLNYFIIDITKKCNLGCVYCFRKRECNDTITEGQLNEILNSIYRYCENNNVRSICVQMWGGEPLTAFERIEQVHNYFADRKVKLKIDIETNGTLITDEMARKLHQMGISIGVSVDGSHYTHNRQRAFADEKPSFENVKNGINCLQKYFGSGFSSLTVVTKYNVNCLKEMLKEMIFSLGLRSFKFNIVRDNRNAAEGGLSPSLTQVQMFYEELINEMLSYYQMGIIISEGNIAARLSNLLTASAENYCCSNGCGGGRKLVSVDFNGDVYPCELTDFKELKLSNVTDADPFQHELLYQNSREFNFEKWEDDCGDCPWQCYCCGGCSSRLYYNGQKSGIDKYECTVNKTIYPRLAEIICEFPQMWKDVVF